jgi:saccharopine dehydrogenase-like NADP-dependent oxidoreductase
VSRVLVLGGAGEMGSVAVRDLVARTDHEVTIGDARPDAAQALAASLPGRADVRAVDVTQERSLFAALAEADAVLNATFMRWVPMVTRAAIRTGTHLVDLGAYWPETAEQLEMGEAARDAGVRVVPGCGVAPGLTNVLARRAADVLDTLVGVSFFSYITHPVTTSPGIVYTRFDASTGISLVCRDGRLEEHPSFSEEEEVEFPPPYGRQRVHLVPHPEPLTLPRTLGVRDVVFKVGYPPEDTGRLRALMDLGFDEAEPFAFGGSEIVPRDFAAAFVGRRGLRGMRTANVKQVVAEGTLRGAPTTLVYDLAVESDEGSASSKITGTVGAISADLVARGGEPGVCPPEVAFEPQAVLEALSARGISVRETRVAGANGRASNRP